MLFVHQIFGFFMKTIRESIDFTSFYMATRQKTNQFYLLFKSDLTI